MWIKHDGTNAWYPKVTIRSSFKADVVDFPFDNQHFIFHFGSWSFGEDKLRIVTDTKPTIDAHFLQDAEWDLLTSRKDTMRTKYDSSTYFDIKFTYIVSRKPAYSVITAIVPSIGLMTLTLFSYVLPPHNGERVKVILTSLLAYIVFLVEINSYLPRNSESVPVIQVFYMVTMCEYIVCFIITCAFVRLFQNEDRNNSIVKVPRWITKLVLWVQHHEVKSSYILNQLDKSQTYEVIAREEVDSVLPEVINGKHDRLTSNDRSAEKKERQRVVEMTWSELLELADRLCMEIFVIMFICSTSIILLPPYWRKYYGDTASFNE